MKRQNFEVRKELGLIKDREKIAAVGSAREQRRSFAVGQWHDEASKSDPDPNLLFTLATIACLNHKPTQLKTKPPSPKNTHYSRKRDGL